MVIYLLNLSFLVFFDHLLPVDQSFGCLKLVSFIYLLVVKVGKIRTIAKTDHSVEAGLLTLQSFYVDAKLCKLFVDNLLHLRVI